MRSTKPLDGPLALQFEPQCDEERGRRRDVVDDDPDVLQTLDGHERPPASSCGVYSSCSRYLDIVVSWCREPRRSRPLI